MADTSEEKPIGFKPILWLGLSFLMGVLWLPVTFLTFILPYVGPLMVMPLVFSPVVYLIIFISKAGQARRLSGDKQQPSVGTTVVLTVIQSFLIIIGAIAFVSLVSNLPGASEWMDIGGHIA